MRRVTVIMLLLGILSAACSVRPEADETTMPDALPTPKPAASPAPPPPASAPPRPACSGEFVDDLERLQEGEEADAVLRCAASVAAREPDFYRASIANWLLLNRATYPGIGQPGYEAFSRATQLAFGEAQVVPAPAGWILRDAAPSPDGRYVAAHLSDGTVGWWALDGSGQDRHKEVGSDLVWHPQEATFAYISGGNRIHVVRLEPAVHAVLEAPGEENLHYPFWAVPPGEGPLSLYGRDPDMVLAIADPVPAGAPRVVAYLPTSREWVQIDGNMTPQTWDQISYPPWIPRPWNPHSGYPVYLRPVAVSSWFRPEGREVLPDVPPMLGHPDAGTPWLFYSLPADAEPLSLTWSPGGWAYAIVERRDSGLVAHILQSFRDYRDRAFSLTLQTEHIAVSDDGATTFTVSGNTVRAKNHLTGEETEWRLEGDILGVRLGRNVLLIVQAELVVVVPYRRAADP